jgi:uncharacterized protein
MSSDEHHSEVFGARHRPSRKPPNQALDRELRATFRHLRDDMSFTAAHREALEEDQRRWVESMDQCWRAGEKMRDCVKASQERRLQQLRSWSAAIKVHP